MKIDQLVKLAFEEDLPSGDATTDRLHLQNRNVRARLVAKQDLVLSGTEFFDQAFLTFEPFPSVKWQFQNGSEVLKGQILTLIEGPAANILKSERVGLNFLGHFSGIATLTKKFVNRVKNSKTQILDTRKTTPLYRMWEKAAVRHGGGRNHRMSLSDAIMIKDNHIEASGGMKAAVDLIRRSSNMKIEVEAQNLQQVQEAVSLNVGRIMLDNMSNDEMREALKIIPPSIETEASGNMDLDRVASVATLGVNFISVGALTHSAPTADVSLQIDWT